MKKITYTLLLVAFTTLFAQDRNVFWAHGLGDDAAFWNQQRTNADRDYRISSSGFTYDTDEGVQRYADRLKAGSAAIGGNQTIAIGHSLGGVALRQVNRDYDGLYGGMITVGSPLDGARLANEVISGGANRFIQQSVDNLRRGPIASSSKTGWQQFIDILGDIVSANPVRFYNGLIRTYGSEAILDILDDVSSGLEQGILDNFDPNDPTVRDLAENSNYMRGIRNFESSQPKILAWGNEDSPVHARLVSSNISLKKSDTDLLIAAYNYAGNFYKARADDISLKWWYGRKKKNRLREEREAWNAGADYIKRGWEIAWNELTDARVLESYTTTQRVYVCDDGNPLDLPVAAQSARITPTPIDCSLDNSCGCRWEYHTVTTSRWVNTPSDGLIKRGSQRGELSNWGNAETAELLGVNHLEMGVHQEADELFQDAFDGNGIFIQFFRTAPR